tara:strand:+ start:99 stop:779 length:681 start_codon:yes stop_codon:yes gene_type:complete
LPFFQSTEFNFENFYIGNSNHELVESLLEWLNCEFPKVFYFWGDVATGKTHLLNAALNQCSDSAIYLPLKEFSKIEPRVFDNLERINIVALDDIDTISGDHELETKFFNLLNKVILSEGKVIITGRNHPNKQGFELNDLVSRLCSGLLYKVSLLADEERKKALAFLASKRGIKIEPRHMDYIMKHFKRDMTNLSLLIDKLDRASLSEGKPVSLNLIKKVTTDSNIY